MRFIVYVHSTITGEVVDLKMFQFRSDALQWIRDHAEEYEASNLYTRLEEDYIL